MKWYPRSEGLERRLAWFRDVAGRRREREQKRAEVAADEENAARWRDRKWRDESSRHERAWSTAWQVRRDALGLSGIATTELAQELLPFDGWSAKDVLWALDAMPDGTEHLGMTLASPVVRLKRRLQPWKDQAGPHTAYTERVLAERQFARERAYLRRVEEAQAQASAVPIPPMVKEELDRLRLQRRARRPGVSGPKLPVD